MSDPLWINAASDIAVGSATIAEADDLFTITDHGLIDGDRVIVSNLAGGAGAVLAEGGAYWVVGALTDTFAVSLTRGGLPVDFTADGSADVNRFDPGYVARELRRADSVFLTKNSDRFGARDGIHPSNNPPVTLSGTTWTVEDVTGVVYPGITTASGPYRFAHPEESGSLNPADGTNDRIDALDLQIQDDDEDNSGFRRALVVYVVGTPAGTPTPPTLTDNSLRLTTILVSAGGTPSPSISTLAQFTVASGGVLPVRDDTELPTAGLYDGLTVYDQDAEAMFVRESITWSAVASPNSPELLAPLTGSGNFVKADYPWGRKLWVRVIGGGGAGGGAPATSSGEGSSGSGGGAGAYAESIIDFADLSASESWSVGSGGTGTSGGSGNDGASSNFGTFVIAAGGTGGSITGPGGGFGATQGGIGGSNASSTGQVVADGAHGGLALRAVSGGAGAFAGQGGESALGGRGGRPPSASASGSSGGVFGGGGSGALNIGSAGSKTGGAGGNGTIILTVI